MHRLRALLVGGAAAFAAATAYAGAPDACAGDPQIDAVVAAIFADADACDANMDDAISGADLAAAIEVRALPACPRDGASLALAIDNRSGGAGAAVTLSGELIEPSCRTRNLDRSYFAELECAGDPNSPCAVVDGLTPGLWRHRSQSGRDRGLQLQYRKTLLIADAVPERLQFTVFASVLTIDSFANAGDGSLRNALQSAAALPKPLLIRFHDLVFPAGVPTVIGLDFQLTTLATDDVTIDGTDELGDVGNRIVDARGLPFGVLSITGARNRIIGLGFRNAGGSNRDVVQISGAAAGGNAIERCIIDGSANGDGVSVDAAAGADVVNVVRDCEILGADDKGVKVTTGARARVETSWVHHNINGGVQATLGGHLETVENLIEDNSGGSAQNGMSIQGFDPISGSSTLMSQGDVVRRNGANGATVRGFALAEIRDGYLAANESSGLRVFNDLGTPAVALAEGTALVCNQVDGAAVADGSRLDLGGGDLGSVGNNALTQNNLPEGAANLRNATENVVSALNSQWEHCGTETTCNDAEIAADDLSDGGQRTIFSPAQAHRALQPPIVTRVSPAKGRAGELLRIYGLRFNAIDGHFDEQQCEDVVGRNRCVPLRGNCVRIGGIAAPVEAVTPTMLVVRWPLTCVSPVPLAVTTDQGSTGLTSETLTVCTAAAGD
jgi:hypothetical protein